jgi:DNA-binding CsgD family transcriptional regulator
MNRYRDELTGREAEILALAARGLSAKLVACELAIATSTVNAHLNTIYLKLRAANRAEAVAIAVRQGLLPPPAS